MNKASHVEFEIVRREDVSAAWNEELYRLLTDHFEGVTRDVFNRDLAEKNLVLTLRRNGHLVGFSTLLACRTWVDGRPYNIIYSGDTIVAPEAWGSTALPRAWVAGVEALRATLPEGRCFWLLLTSGFRTYRFLPVFWREFYPSFDSPTPLFTRRLIQAAASERFGSQYDSRLGVVRFSQPQRLRARLAVIPDGREADPHVSFFVSLNPGHAAGDELVCLTELCAENLTAAGRRMMRPITHELASNHC